MATNIFSKYYFDVTKYNVLFALLIGIRTDFSWCFGLFGSLFSFFVYRYYHQEEYIFYGNAGWSKTRLIGSVFGINLGIAALLKLFL